MVFGGCLSDGKSNNNVTYIDLESGSVFSYATKSGMPAVFILNINCCLRIWQTK